MIQHDYDQGLHIWSIAEAQSLRNAFLAAIADPGPHAVLKEDAKGWVRRLEIQGQSYILKKVCPDDHQLERALKRLIKGSYFVALLRRTAQAWRRGNRAPCGIYLVAEERRLGWVKATYILMEYIEGTPLAELPDWTVHREQIKELILDLHRVGLSSGDVHAGNLMLTTQGLRIIDLSGRGASAISRAKDRYGLWRSFGIPNDIQDWAYRWVLLRLRLRNAWRRLRGKKPIG